jgi:hypothetical protein
MQKSFIPFLEDAQSTSLYPLITPRKMGILNEKMCNIYIIKLEEDKRLIHFSKEKSESKLFKECEIYYDYAKKYKPLVLEEIIPLVSYLDVDTQVKLYMQLYGYLNVRGGSYIEDPLPEYQEKSLLIELSLLAREELRFTDTLSEILKKYECREYASLEEIDSEIQKVKSKFAKYNLEKERMERITYFGENGMKNNIQTYADSNMKWLYELCCIKTFQYESESLKKNEPSEIEPNLRTKNATRYKKTLKCLKHLYSIFEEFDLFDKYSINNTVELKHPEFAFDKYLYHYPTLKTNPPLSHINEICKTFQIMWDVVYNMASELECDVSSYGDDFLWKVPRILYILEKKREEIE